MVGCRTPARAGDEPRVLAENSVAVTRFRLAPSRPAAIQFRSIHVELEQQLISINCDAVAFLNQPDRSTNSSFWGHVTHNEAIGAAAEAAIGDQGDLVPKALTNDCLLYTSPSPRD